MWIAEICRRYVFVTKNELENKFLKGPKKCVGTLRERPYYDDASGLDNAPGET